MLSFRRGAALLSTAIGALACSDPPAMIDPPAADAGVIDAAFEPPVTAMIDPPLPPAPVLSPALPSFAPCAAGWREIARGCGPGCATCEAWPESGPLDCAPGMAHFPGTPGCERIGSACPAGEWPESLPADKTILHVRAGAPAGGDGTRLTPFSTITEAIAAASPGTIIALAKGRFDEAITLPAGVTLWGACVAETEVTASTASTVRRAAIVRAGGPEVGVRNLRISGRRFGFAIGPEPADAELVSVAIEGAETVGVFVVGRATLRATELLVRGTRPEPVTGQGGEGLEIKEGARAEVTRALFEHNRDIGILVIGPETELTLADIAVRETDSSQRDGTFGAGLIVQAGARVEVARAAFERNRHAGVRVVQAGTSVDLEEVIVRDTDGNAESQSYGRGLEVDRGAHVEGRRMVLVNNRLQGVGGAGAGTSIALADVLIAHTRPHGLDGNNGEGATVFGGAQLRAQRIASEDNRNAGISGIDPGTFLELSDVVVRDTRWLDADGSGGYGLAIAGGANMRVERAQLDENATCGVWAGDADTRAELIDVSIEETALRQADGSGGSGVCVFSGAFLAASRARLERNPEAGVLVHGADAAVELEDLLIRGTERAEESQRVGRAINAEQGASVAVTRARLERTRGTALLVHGSGTSAVIADVEIRQTKSSTLGDFGRGISVGAGAALRASRVRIDGAAELGLSAFGEGSSAELSDVSIEATEGGSGVAAIDFAAIALRRFSSSKQELGAQVASAGALALEKGEVSFNRIGVNVQSEAFDFARLMNGVVYRENAIDLDRSALPLPLPDEPLFTP